MSHRRFIAIALTLIVVLLEGSPLGAVNRRAFVTSTAYDGNIADQPVSGATALDKADTLCRTRAAVGGLPNAATYRAWLSTSTTDAYCHVQGLAGKKSSGCGGAAQPGAGPWYQANGITAFTDSLAKLTGPERVIYRNLLMNEYQDVVAQGTVAWTGTTASGEYSTVPCANWNSANTTLSATTGAELMSATGWTQDGYWACNYEHSLICLEPGASASLMPFWSPGSLVFVTRDPHAGGNLATWPGAAGAVGLAAGDAICQAEAAAAHLPAPESFVAWLSASAVDAIDRLQVDGPFKRVDGFTVASSREDLVDGATAVSIHVSADGSYLQDSGAVATGTSADGTWTGNDCEGWSIGDSSGIATRGTAAYSRVSYWTDHGVLSCSNSALRLYCFSNAVTLFWDGFERAGDLSRWSAAVGVP